MNFWHDVPFEDRVSLFSLSHIVFIVSVLVIVGVFLWKMDYVKKNWNTIRKVFITLSILQVLALYSWSFIELGFDLKAGLPIHLCRLSTLIGLYFLFTEDKRVLTPLFYMSIFALVAIMYPVNVHPIYAHIIGWSYQISHILIILLWIVIVKVYNYKPTYRVMNISIIVFFVLEVLVWRFNLLIGGGEYLYILSDVNRPFFKSWPDMVWILFTIVLSYGVMFLMTFPFNRKQVVSE